jgi:dipeptide transport system permease protein
MLKFLASRVLTFLPTFFGVTIISFAFIRLLPGDPIVVMAGERGVSAERYAELVKQLGFDRPMVVQYFDYLWGVLHGDLGQSFVTKKPVWDEFFALFPATVELSFCAIIFAIAIGLPAGVIAAVNRGKFFDRALMSTALVGYSMPIFWWALLLIIVMSGWLGLTPVSGRISLLYFFDTPTGFMLIDSLLSGQKGAFGSAVLHLVLPTIVLGTIPLAVIARQTRSAILEVLSEDYIRTARAKGLSPIGVNGVHALRNVACGPQPGTGYRMFLARLSIAPGRTSLSATAHASARNWPPCCVRPSRNHTRRSGSWRRNSRSPYVRAMLPLALTLCLGR